MQGPPLNRFGSYPPLIEIADSKLLAEEQFSDLSMRRARRAISDPRLELTPLLDVMFLLLTFFIFAFVLMVRLEVTDIRLPTAQAGQSVERAPALTISVREDGGYFIADRSMALEEVAPAIDAARSENPSTQLLIAVDERAPAGVVFRLMDTHRAAGPSDLRVRRAPSAPDTGGVDSGPPVQTE